MAKKKRGKKPASPGVPPAVSHEPATPPVDSALLAAWDKKLESVDPELSAALKGLLVANPAAAIKVLEELEPCTAKAKQHEDWVNRIARVLNESEKYSPHTAAFVGKAMAVRSRVDPRNRHRISRPDIYGVFASKEASGVLPDDGDLYSIAVACAKRKGRSLHSNPISNKLTKPLAFLNDRAIVDRDADSGLVWLCDGCEEIFTDRRIPWPTPIKRNEYVEPKGST